MHSLGDARTKWELLMVTEHWRNAGGERHACGRAPLMLAMPVFNAGLGLVVSYLSKQIVNRIDATPPSEPARADARGGGELDAVGILILSQARGFCSNIAGLARKLRFIVRRMSAIDRALAHILG